ncbi:MAG: type II toxin-antitoxin system VapC family toxin [Candidatus Bathyarchaeia archaeon]
MAELERKQLTLSTTVINALELCYGAHKSARKVQNLPATGNLLDSIVILNMTLKSVEKAAEIHAELEPKGQPIGIRDAMIGAIALTKGYLLIT